MVVSVRDAAPPGIDGIARVLNGDTARGIRRPQGPVDHSPMTRDHLAFDVEGYLGLIAYEEAADFGERHFSE